MTERIRDAWKVLRGQAKACPVDATWYVVTSAPGHPPYWTFGDDMSGTTVSYS